MVASFPHSSSWWSWLSLPAPSWTLPWHPSPASLWSAHQDTFPGTAAERVRRDRLFSLEERHKEKGRKKEVHSETEESILGNEKCTKCIKLLIVLDVCLCWDVKVFERLSVCFSYFILLVLAEGPDGPQVPAGAPAIRKALNNQIHIGQTFLVGWGFPHGRWSIGDPGTPVILHNVHKDTVCAFTQVLYNSTSLMLKNKY